MGFLNFLVLVNEVRRKMKTPAFITALMGQAQEALEPIERSNYQPFCLNNQVWSFAADYYNPFVNEPSPILRNVKFMAPCRHVTQGRSTLAHKHRLWGQMLCHNNHGPEWSTMHRSTCSSDPTMCQIARASQNSWSRTGAKATIQLQVWKNPITQA